MNKQDVINAMLAGDPKLTKKAAGVALNSALDAIGGALAKGDTVQLIGFGTFFVRHTNERKGRNPASGKEMIIKAGNKVSFRVGKALKDKVAK